MREFYSKFDTYIIDIELLRRSLDIYMYTLFALFVTL